MAQELLGAPVHEGRVLDEWIDVNAHMNVAYYVLAFDAGIDKLWLQLGITPDYVRDRRMSTFAVEAHVEYLQELRRGAPIIVTTQVLAFDEKRIHQYLRMYHRDEGFLAATSEWMNLHVDLETRRVSPWSPDILQNIREFSERQESTAMPDRAGRRIQIRQPQYSLYDTNEGTA